MALLHGKTAVVTGGGGGLGRAIMTSLLDAGANVVLVDMSPAILQAVVVPPESTSRTRLIVGDVSDADDLERVATEALAAFGSLDVWVNNAGFTRDATMRRMSEDDFDDVIRVHLKGTWLGTRTAAGIMREQPGGGSIINMSSISGKVGNIGQTNYSAAKAGIVGLTKAAAKEVGFARVRVNAVQPGLINTPMTEALSDEVRQQRLGDVPLGRFGEPAEVAACVLFLASAMSSYVTGTVLEISGGRHI